MSRLIIELLGTFRVTLDERPVTGFKSDKVRALLAFLAVNANRPHRREMLATLLWAELPHSDALANLRYALYDLRKVIDDYGARPPYLLISREALQFDVASEHRLDVHDLRRLARPVGGPSPDLSALRRAASLYRGPFLQGFSVDSGPFEEWVIIQRERLERRTLDLLTTLARHHEENEEYERALDYARRQLELAPWLEEAHRRVMRLLSTMGRPAAALAQYETCRRVLAEELDVGPSAATAALYERIRQRRSRSPSSKEDETGWRSLDAALELALGKPEELDRQGASAMERTVSCLIQAGVRAVQLSANEEAVVLLSHGLALLRPLSPTPARQALEARLRLALSGPLLARQGWGSRERAEALEHAFELCDAEGQALPFLEALFISADLARARGDHAKSLELGKRMLSLAQRCEVGEAPVLAHWTVGETSFFMGDFPAALHHLKEVTSRHATEQLSLTSVTGTDAGVTCRAWLAWTHWVVGHPQRALDEAEDALNLARKLGHPLSVAFAHAVGRASILLLSKQVERVSPHVTALARMIREHDLEVMVPWREVFGGYLEAYHGKVDQGIARMRAGSEAWAATGAVTGRTFQLMLLAESYLTAQRLDEATRVLDEALELTRAAGENAFTAEYERLRGEVARAGGDGAEAIERFRRALNLAHQQGARAWELRAAVSLARALGERGQRAEARALLAPVYATFTEGFDTPDLRVARDLLTSLGQTRIDSREG
jgi:DNA-binding SARP family transcriptional activator